MSQEVGVVWLFVNGHIVVPLSFVIILQGMIGTTETIFDAPVGLEGRRILLLLLVLEILSLLEVFNGSLVVLLSMSALAESIVSL